MAPRSVDIAVLGNGVLGLSLGLVLARRGASVAIIGDRHRLGGASPAAGAMLGCFAEVTSTSLASPYGRQKFELALRARAAWPEWLAGLDGDTSSSRGGSAARMSTSTSTVVLLNTVGLDVLDTSNYTAILSALEERGEPHEEIDPAAVEWIDPDPLSRPLRALHIPGEGAIDAVELLLQLESAVLALGAALVDDDEACSIELQGTRATGVALRSGGRIAAGQVVVAAGARSQEIIESVPGLAERMPRVCSGVGISATLGTGHRGLPPSVVRTPNRAFACGLHLVPRASGDLYIGATNGVAFEPEDRPALGEFQFLADCAVRQVKKSLVYGQLLAVHAGNRPVSTDGFPLIGRTSTDGLWILTGTYRDGLHLSPVLATELAGALLGGRLSAELSSFAPERRPITVLSRSETVTEVAKHMVASGYEHGWHVPVEWPAVIRREFTRGIQNVVDRLGDDFTPPPDIVAAARDDPRLLDWLADSYKRAAAAPGV